jgi:hypothetical protein
MTVTVAQDVTGAASAATVQIKETLYFTGNYQNIDAQPANGATLTLFPGTSSPSGKVGQAGLAFTKEAFAAISLPLPMPKNEEKSSVAATDPDTGLCGSGSSAASTRRSASGSTASIRACSASAGCTSSCAVRVLCA